MPKWTEDQERVIRYRNGNLLVSAAAGSGKTAVLVERIISMITDETDPVSLDELLVMTFTEAAASEMRERIRTALEEKLMEQPDHQHLIREAGNIQNANINTIDAFCKHLISENYAAVDLDPGFRIGDQGELKLLQGDLIESILEERYAEPTARFLRFMDAFSRGKEDAGIDEIILKLYQFSQANPWPEEWIEAQMQELQGRKEETAAWKLWLAAYLRARLSEAEEKLAAALEICREPDGPESYLPTLEDELRQIREASQAETMDNLAKQISGISFGRLKATKSEKKALAADPRNAVKKEIRKLAEELVFPEGKDQIYAEEGTRESITELLDLCSVFSQRYAAEKERRHMLDFNDLEHYALRVLYTGEGDARKPSAIADDYAQRFREILVDEYQDSNYVQEALIAALSAERFGRPDVFQVGDVKQSIYGFRLARPELFLNKYQDPEYPTIELSRNFRSRKEVIHAVNTIFFRLMKEETGGIAYTDRTALYPGREAEASELDFGTELLVSRWEEDAVDASGEESSKAEAEAAVIAARIRELMEDGYRYQDIVILMRSPGAWADTVVEVLGANGIPAYAATNEGYFSAMEVETVLAMLSIIDNPRQDIPLAAVMRSPIYGFTDAELAEIRVRCGSLQRSFPFTETVGLDQKLWIKLENFWKDVDSFRELAQYLSIHELLYQIYQRSGYYYYVSAMPDGARRRANLDALIDSALTYETTSYKGLFHFIRYIEKLKKYESDQGEASIYSEQDDLVRIMSIHKSKGLQFPVVFVAGMGRRFNKQDLAGKILIDPVLGIGCDYVDAERKLRIPSMKRCALKHRLENEQLGEELRVLYVALSRAQDKLIMTGCSSDPDRLLEKYASEWAELSPGQILGASCMLEWIMMAAGPDLLRTDGKENIRIRVYAMEELIRNSRQDLQDAIDMNLLLQETIKQQNSESILRKQIRKEFGYRYPFEAATELYPKHSVSEIKEAGMSVLEGDPFVSGTSEDSKRETAGALRGNAYHRALALYDYERGPEQLQEILNPEEQQLIDPEKLRTFLESEIGICFRQAQREQCLYREQHFMKEVSYQYLFPESGIAEPVLLQGIIDAFVIKEDGIILVDYKTDRVSDSQTLISRYGRQLELYADALEAMLQKPVRERLIYSFHLGKAVRC